MLQDPYDSQEYRYKYRLLDVCDWLHGSVSGSGPGMADKSLALFADWLSNRLSYWRTPNNSPYEAAIFDLCHKALSEARNYLRSIH